MRNNPEAATEYYSKADLLEDTQARKSAKRLLDGTPVGASPFPLVAWNTHH